MLVTQSKRKTYYVAKISEMENKYFTTFDLKQKKK